MNPEEEPPDQTTDLLSRWHNGDRQALEQLLGRNLEWIHNRVRQRLGAKLRAKADSVDYVQEAMVEVLSYAPRFTCDSQGRFRALMARIVENVLRDHADFYSARRRAMSQEAQQVGCVTLDGEGASCTGPHGAAERSEEHANLRLALELLDPRDREIIVLRQWDGLEYRDIGQRLGVDPNTARMRFHRALPRLADRMDEIQRGAPGTA